MSVPFPSRQQLDRGAQMRTERRMSVQAARKGRKITTRRPDVCDACGHDIAVGASAFWSAGAGIVHDDPDCLAGLGIDEYRPPSLTVSQITRRELAADQAWRDHQEGLAEAHLLAEEHARGEL